MNSALQTDIEWLTFEKKKVAVSSDIVCYIIDVNPNSGNDNWVQNLMRLFITLGVVYLKYVFSMVTAVHI